MRDERQQSYIDERCSPIPSHLVTVERNTHLRALSPQMLGGHMQGRFLVWLTEWLSPKRILEIGTFTGYSALCFAERLQANGEVHSIEINDELLPIIKDNLALATFADKIHVHIGDANQLVPQLPGTWDLVYLDAKKDDYPSQFEMVASRLAPKGYILLDNVLWGGHVLDTTKLDATTVLLRDFTRKLAESPEWETLMLPMSDGLLLVRRANEFLP